MSKFWDLSFFYFVSVWILDVACHDYASYAVFKKSADLHKLPSAVLIHT